MCPQEWRYSARWPNGGVYQMRRGTPEGELIALMASQQRGQREVLLGNAGGWRWCPVKTGGELDETKMAKWCLANEWGNCWLICPPVKGRIHLSNGGIKGRSQLCKGQEVTESSGSTTSPAWRRWRGGPENYLPGSVDRGMTHFTTPRSTC